MFKKKPEAEVEMTALNADITTQSMEMLKLAKLLRKEPIKVIVQEAVDLWLEKQGITPDKLPTLPKPKK